MHRRTTVPLWTLRVLLFVCLGGQGSPTSGPARASADTLRIGRYEVKFLLKADSVLKSPEAPSDEIRLRDLGPYFAPAPNVPPQSMTIRFLDDKALSLHNEGWAVRIRQVPDEPLEVVYKKRYPMNDADEARALAAAQHEGFPFQGAGQSKVEVDWSQHGRAVSLSYEVEAQKDAASLETLLSLVRDRAPEPFKSLAVAQALPHARVCGPIEARRWTGPWKGVDGKADIEVWSVPREGGNGTEPIVEVSFKAESLDKATSNREALERILVDKGWLFEKGVPKTDLVLRRCAAAWR